MSKTGKKQKKKALDPSQGIMQGIQSIHGWMSAQTKITPRGATQKKVVEISSEEVLNVNKTYTLIWDNIIGGRYRCTYQTYIWQSTEAA